MSSGIYDTLLKLEEESNIAIGLADLWRHISSGDKMEYAKLVAIEAFIEAIEERTNELKSLVEKQKDSFSHVTITVEGPSD